MKVMHESHQSKGIVGAALQHVDFLLQSRICLVQPFFVDDAAAAAGAGIYTTEDWNRIRQHQTVPLGSCEDRYGSDDAYRRYLASIDQSKILSVRSLLRAFDFRKYDRILELGCGDMPQAFVVSSQFPNISYTATDFDPHVIANCARLPLLSNIHKLVLDVTRDDLAVLQDHDLAVSWSLEFSLSDEQLVNLFAACRTCSVPYLLCTHAAIGPIGYLHRSRLMKGQVQHVPKNRHRMIGWLRSVREIVRLARQAGMALQSKGLHVNHVALFFMPT
jgi:O-methyltransferase